MAITSYGYEGTVDEVEYARITTFGGGVSYSVSGPGDLNPQAGGNGDRAVTIAPGEAVGMGVRVESDAAVTKNLASVSSGARWDLIVLRRNWNTNSSSIEVVTGSAVKALPERNTALGSIDDQPIALARVTAGSTAVTQIVDLRVWTSDGGSYAKDKLVLSFLNRLGTQVLIDTNLWCRAIGVTGSPEWVTSPPLSQFQKAGANIAGIVPIDPGSNGTPIIKAGMVTDLGKIAFGNQYLQKVVFPAQFPNGIITVQLTPIQVASSNPPVVAPDVPIVLDEMSQTGFSAMIPRTTTLSTRAFLWLAVGF